MSTRKVCHLLSIQVLLIVRLDLTSSENKAYKEFSVVGGHEKENPQLEMYFKAYADLQYALSEQRGLMVCS